MFDMQSKIMTGTFNPEMMAEVMPKFAGYFGGEITWKFNQEDELKGDFGACMASFGEKWFGSKNNVIEHEMAVVNDGTGKNFVVYMTFSGNLTDAAGNDVEGTAYKMLMPNKIGVDDEGKLIYWHQMWDTAFHNANKLKVSQAAPAEAPAEAPAA